MYLESTPGNPPAPRHICLPKWRKRIKDAKERGYFTSGDEHDSLHWNLCAVGEAISTYKVQTEHTWKSLLFRKSAPPTDITLYNLGVNFYNAVWDDQVYKAERILTSIEQRLEELDQIRTSA